MFAILKYFSCEEIPNNAEYIEKNSEKNFLFSKNFPLLNDS